MTRNESEPGCCAVCCAMRRWTVEKVSLSIRLASLVAKPRLLMRS